jgi:hypothetical protein
VGVARVNEARPAFYALAPGGWRDYVTLLHPPYTLWHLSYVVIGAALAPDFDGRLLGWTLVAFFLALGVGAHALDELNGHPLALRIAPRVLVALAVTSIAAAAAIGIVIAAQRDLWLLAFVAAGAFLVTAYNLEFFAGTFHSDAWFAIGWGSFPLLTAYFASARTVRADALVAAVFALLLSLAQRTLSTQVRNVRRRTTAVSGRIEHSDGSSTAINAETLTRAPETALRMLCGAAIAIALTLVLMRVT